VAIQAPRLDQVQQTVCCHREPLFLAPTGLAVGLALKEVRYGVLPIRPWARGPLVPPLPPHRGGGIRQVFPMRGTLSRSGARCVSRSGGAEVQVLSATQRARRRQGGVACARPTRGSG
jgi:hypothetical protein